MHTVVTGCHGDGHAISWYCVDCVDVLSVQELLQSYENSNDTWRVVSYHRAVQVLKKHPKQITTREVGASKPQSLCGLGTCYE